MYCNYVENDCLAWSLIFMWLSDVDYGAFSSLEHQPLRTGHRPTATAKFFIHHSFCTSTSIQFNNSFCDADYNFHSTQASDE